jgi:hypothetical protein
MNRYQVLFNQYVTEMRAARAAALEWWQGLVDAEAQRHDSPSKADEQLRSRWPFGAASHPYVIATYRKYYLACAALNDRLALEQRAEAKVDDAKETDWGSEDETPAGEDWGEEWALDPPTLLFEMLDGRDDELADFLGTFVFPCIGEEDGRPT